MDGQTEGWTVAEGNRWAVPLEGWGCPMENKPRIPRGTTHWSVAWTHGMGLPQISAPSASTLTTILIPAPWLSKGRTREKVCSPSPPRPPQAPSHLGFPHHHRGNSRSSVDGHSLVWLSCAPTEVWDATP